LKKQGEKYQASRAATREGGKSYVNRNVGSPNAQRWPTGAVSRY
jgi:hypothetical protein